MDNTKAMRRLEAVTARMVGQNWTDSPMSPNQTSGEEASDVNMYSSSQQALLGTNANSECAGTVSTEIDVGKVSHYVVPSLFASFPHMKLYENHFVRTRTRVRAPRDSTVSVTHVSKPAGQSARYNQLISKGEVVLLDIARKSSSIAGVSAFTRAGPTAKIVWAPYEVKAAIVTCGGLCPGLNDVIAELFNCLHYNYGVDIVYGIRNGLRGFWDDAYRPWNVLTPRDVHGIHELGGTVLGSSRGGFDKTKIVDALLEHGVNQLYIIGGDGTHRAAFAIHEEITRRGLKIIVAGVPKTIDNDIGIIDHSFGFNTAVAQAKNAIRSAVVEAKCTPGGIGIVKLMGRHAGYIAAHATLSSRETDVCLIPEVPFPLEGLMNHLQSVVKSQGHAVIVVAEGAGKDLIKATKMTDESGNPVLPDVGKFLSLHIGQHMKDAGIPSSIKYHDPSYMVRSVPANASDSIMCLLLAQNAVHGAMSGYTGFSSGLVNNRSVLLPMDLLCAVSPAFMNPHGRTWERVLTLTHQPKWNTKKEDSEK